MSQHTKDEIKAFLSNWRKEEIAQKKKGKEVLAKLRLYIKLPEIIELFPYLVIAIKAIEGFDLKLYKSILVEQSILHERKIDVKFESIIKKMHIYLVSEALFNNEDFKKTISLLATRISLAEAENIKSLVSHTNNGTRTYTSVDAKYILDLVLQLYGVLTTKT